MFQQTEAKIMRIKIMKGMGIVDGRFLVLTIKLNARPPANIVQGFPY